MAMDFKPVNNEKALKLPFFFSFLKHISNLSVVGHRNSVRVCTVQQMFQFWKWRTLPKIEFSSPQFIVAYRQAEGKIKFSLWRMLRYVVMYHLFQCLCLYACLIFNSTHSRVPNDFTPPCHGNRCRVPQNLFVSNPNLQLIFPVSPPSLRPFVRSCILSSFEFQQVI